MHKVFAFVPGEKIHIHVKFGDQIPNHYRLQVLDHRSNSRLNRYGKGSNEGIILDWPIPHTIRDEHFGVWQIQMECDTGSFSQIFYVEHHERIEPPMLFAAPMVLEIVEEHVVVPTSDEIISEEVISQDISVMEPSIEASTDQPAFVSKTPVTAIKGLGKTYADRLAKIQIFSLSDFWYYPNRVSLAENMRVTDSKLSRMLQDAEILLSQEAEIVTLPPDKQIEIIPDDLLSIEGIGQKTVEKLAQLGIKSKSDLMDFDDLETLQKTLRTSRARLEKLLASVGRIIAPAKVIEPIPIDPLNQPVTSVKGIGVKTAQRLGQRGIMIVQDLLNSSFTTMKGLASETSYNKWRQNAAILVGRQPDKLVTLAKVPTKIDDLTSIPGVGPKTAQRLDAAGIATINDLIQTNLEELVIKTGFSQKRLILWQTKAKKLYH